MDDRDFKAESVRRIAEELIHSHEAAERAAALGKKLAEAGSLTTLIKNI